ncbi:MAG: Gfo/Idh/MocA family protein [Spirochaetota bacterium]
MEQVRVGILGCGFIGGTHAKALAKVDGVEITALCDSERGKAEALARRLADDPSAPVSGAGPSIHTRFGEMIAGDVDAVFVCLPPFAHDGEVEQAAAAGKHVFIEKPIALTTDAAGRMVDAAEAAGIVTQVGYMMRFSPAIERIRSLIEDGTAGRPTLYQATYNCNALHAPWWRERAKSGGQIFEQAIHLYDLALHFLGEPATVSAAMANLCHQDVENYSIEDTSSAVIQFTNGAIGNLNASNCAVPGEWNHAFTLVCERMVATLRNGSELELVFTGGEEVRRETATFDDDVFVAEDAAFIDSVRAGRPSPVPMSVGRAGVRLVEAATRAAETRTVVRL